MIRVALRAAIAALVLIPMPAEPGSGVILSVASSVESALTADPASPFWQAAQPVVAANDQMGQPAPGHRTEIRSRWTKQNLYILFVCPYQQLHLKQDHFTDRETNELWNWDVGEAFIGSDFANIRRYKEFELSPQGEWVDLDIDRDHPLPEGGWLWNSGFQVKARVDAERKIWYGEMRIPFSAIAPWEPAAGRELRINFYRAQGGPPERRTIAWQPTHSRSFHVPESFGRMRLVEK